MVLLLPAILEGAEFALVSSILVSGSIFAMLLASEQMEEARDLDLRFASVSFVDPLGFLNKQIKI